jgi:hypothetical protein
MGEPVTMSNPDEHGVIEINCERSKQNFFRAKQFQLAGSSYYPQTVDKNSQVIKKGDVVMRSLIPESYPGHDRLPRIICALNGAPVNTELTEDQQYAAMCKSIKPLGIALADLPFDENSNADDPIAVQAGGIGTIINTGTTPLRMDALCEVVPPHKDLRECAQLPGYYGPDAAAKIRPVTREFDFRIHSDTTKSIKEPPVVPGSNEPVLNIASDSATSVIPKADIALWLGMSAVASVGLAMGDYIDELVVMTARTANLPAL